MSKVWTKSDLIDFCNLLCRDEQYDEVIGYHFWKEINGRRLSWPLGECGQCTCSASIISHEFQGKVAGYEMHSGDAKTLVGYACFGHDFAVVGDYIVDWWGWQYEQAIPCPVILKEEGIAAGLYKPERFWDMRDPVGEEYIYMESINEIV